MNTTDSEEKEDSATTQPQSPVIIEARTDNKKKATRQKAGDSDHKKSLRRSWRSSQPTTKLTIIFTGVMALATTLYMIFSGWQLHEIRSGGEETRKLAQAARDSADAAQRQANIAAEQLQAVRDSAQAAKDSASAASTATEQNKEMVKAAQVQANTSQVLAIAAERSARISEQALRAQISIEQITVVSFEPNKTILFFIVWKNDGNSPATIVSSIAKIGISPRVPAEGVCQGMPNAPMLPFTVSPHNTRAQTMSVGTGDFSPEEIQAVKDGKSYFVICGQVVYTTVGIRDAFPLCSYSSKDLNFFLECGTRIEQ
jgi:hypothetical protein